MTVLLLRRRTILSSREQHRPFWVNGAVYALSGAEPREPKPLSNQ